MKLFLGTLVLMLSMNAFSAGIPIAGFSDLGFKYQTNDDGTTKTDSNNFYQGGVDFYYTKDIGQGVNALAEIVFEMGDDNGAVLDIERLWLQKTLSPWLKVKFGRVHTALGYWNDTYHHGTWLHNSIMRPLMYRFEDASGILPMHSMGLELRGSGKMGMGTLGYIVNVGNGRGVTVDPPAIISDANRGKAFNVLAYYELQNGLRFGGVVYTDDLKSGTITPAAGSTATAVTSVDGKELISGGHLIFKNSKIEFLSEFLNIRHTYKDAAKTKTNTTAMYAQIGYTVDKMTPYVRYDEVKADKDNSDSYFFNSTVASGATAFNGSKGMKESQIVAGVRYDMTYTSALKFEYIAKKLESITAKTAKTNSFNVNWSFAW